MTPEQAEVELKEHPEDVIQPSALFRSAMDHSRRNYSFALGAFCAIVMRRDGACGVAWPRRWPRRVG